jgi:hypothetical protein
LPGLLDAGGFFGAGSGFGFFRLLGWGGGFGLWISDVAGFMPANVKVGGMNPKNPMMARTEMNFFMDWEFGYKGTNKKRLDF